MEITFQSDYQIADDFFKNGSIYDPSNSNSSATNETRISWGQKLAFWTVPVSLAILALLVVCGLILCIEQRCRSFESREQNTEREFQMMQVNRPLRNLTPRASISSNLRVAAEVNPEPRSNQTMLPTKNTGTLEQTEMDSQETPKELLITELTLKLATLQGNNLALEKLPEMVEPSVVVGKPSESEAIKAKIIEKDMDEEKVALGKDRGGWKSDQFFPLKRASKALNVSA